MRSSSADGAEHLARPPGRVAVGQAVEPVAAQPEPLPPGGGQRVGAAAAGRPAWNAVSKQATAGTPGSSADTTSMPPSARG